MDDRTLTSAKVSPFRISRPYAVLPPMMFNVIMATKEDSLCECFSSKKSPTRSALKFCFWTVKDCSWRSLMSKFSLKTFLEY